MEKPIKKFLRYSVLNIMGMLGISCYILADTFFIANGIGADGLASLNLAIPIYSFIHGCGLMLGTGGATKYIIARCQGEHVRANAIFTNSIKAGMIVSIFFISCGLFLSHELTHLLKADAAIYSMTHTYLKVILLFAPFFITNEQLLAYVRNDGKPDIAMTAMVSGSIANILLDYLFIYPMQMGILGAVLATGIAPVVSMLILFCHIRKNSCGFHLIHISIDSKTVKDFIILGFPSLVTEVSTGLVIIVFNLLLMEQSGNIGVAAYGIIANIALVTTAVFTGLAQGVQPLISEAHSASLPKLLHNYHYYALITAAILSISIYLLIFKFTSPITALFNGDANADLQILGEIGMRIYFISLPLTALNIILCTFFTATEHPFPAHIISLLRGLIIVLPLAFWMSHHHGLTGIWLTVPIAELLTTVIAIILRINQPTTKSPAL